MARLTQHWRLEVEYTIAAETWRNSIDIASLTAGDVPPNPSDVGIGAGVGFFFGMQYSTVTCVSATLRNIYYHEPTHPAPVHPPVWINVYNIPGGGNTLWGGSFPGNALPADVALFVKKVGPPSKPGKLFIRNILTEGDVSAVQGGEWALSGGGQFSIATFNAHVVSSIGPYLSGGSAGWSYEYSITHLTHTPPTDTRTPYGTGCTQLVAIRPVWNDSRR